MKLITVFRCVYSIRTERLHPGPLLRHLRVTKKSRAHSRGNNKRQKTQQEEKHQGTVSVSDAGDGADWRRGGGDGDGAGDSVDDGVCDGAFVCATACAAVEPVAADDGVDDGERCFALSRTQYASRRVLSCASAPASRGAVPARADPSDAGRIARSIPERGNSVGRRQMRHDEDFSTTSEKT